MQPRRVGLIGIGSMLACGGAAGLLRAGYVAMPLWRRGLGWGAVALGLLCLLAAARRGS
jgi:hypothetical protein